MSCCDLPGGCTDWRIACQQGSTCHTLNVGTSALQVRVLDLRQETSCATPRRSWMAWMSGGGNTVPLQQPFHTVFTVLGPSPAAAASSSIQYLQYLSPPPSPPSPPPPPWVYVYVYVYVQVQA